MSDTVFLQAAKTIESRTALAALNSAQGTKAAAPPDFVSLTPEGLLIFCQSQLRDLDEQIQTKMSDQQNLVNLQSDVTAIQNAISGETKGATVGGDAKNFAFNDKPRVDEISGMIEAASKRAESMGDHKLVENLAAVMQKLTEGDNGSVSRDEVKEMTSMLDSSLAACRGSAEMRMISLQSLISKRATGLQLITGMMSSLNESLKAIAGNIR